MASWYGRLANAHLNKHFGIAVNTSSGKFLSDSSKIVLPVKVRMLPKTGPDLLLQLKSGEWVKLKPML